MNNFAWHDNNECEWRYDNNLNFNEDKHIIYYNPEYEDLVILPKKSFFDNPEDYEYEVNYIKELFTTRHEKILYGYMPDFCASKYYDSDTDTWKDDTILTSDCFCVFENHGIWEFQKQEWFLTDLYDQAGAYIINTLLKIPHELFVMYDNIDTQYKLLLDNE